MKLKEPQEIPAVWVEKKVRSIIEVDYFLNSV
jgi:hypothetical protein